MKANRRHGNQNPFRIASVDGFLTAAILRAREIRPYSDAQKARRSALLDALGCLKAKELKDVQEAFKN